MFEQPHIKSQKLVLLLLQQKRYGGFQISISKRTQNRIEM